MQNFIPAEHNRSLKGMLAPYIKGPLPKEEDWDRLADEAVEDAVVEDFLAAEETN